MSSSPSEDARVPVAIVGFGAAGAGIHATLVASNPRLELAVIVARDAGRREAAARRFPDTETSDSLGATEGCAVAVVALPLAYRGDVVEELLDLGLRVVVEKPFAGSVEHALRLASHAPERLAVFHNRRWDSDFLTLARLRAEGAWAGPVRMASRIQRWQPTVRDGWRNRAGGGGYLLEVGPHLVDQAIALLGPVTDVYAEVGARRGGTNVEDDAFLALYHRDGSISHLFTSALGNPAAPRFELASTRALVVIGAGDPQQDQLMQGLTPSDATWGVADAEGWSIRHDEEPAVPVRAERGWWPGYYDAVALWATGGPPPVPVASGVVTLAVIDAARVSARERRLVALAQH